MMNIGEFTVESGRIRVTDPCYEPDTWCAYVIDDAKKGLWTAKLSYMEGRVSELRINHFSHSTVEPAAKTDAQIGVDSGQAGFYDDAFFVENHGGEYGELDTFYGKNCNATIEHDTGIIEECGVVSSSGWGDGVYDLYVARDKDGLVIAAKIVFLYDEEDEDEEEDEIDDQS